jgi:hypothetical protein
MALRKKFIPNELPGNREEITVYLADDAQGIFAGNEAKRPGAGSGRTATRLRQAAAERAKVAVFAILAEGQPRTTHYILEHARIRGVNPRAAREAMRLYTKYEDGPGHRRWRTLLPDASPQNNGHLPNAPEPDRAGNQELRAASPVLPGTDRHRPKRRGRGRPQASEDPRVKERRKKIVDTWNKCLQDGSVPSISQMAETCCVDRSTVKAALQDAGIDWRR